MKLRSQLNCLAVGWLIILAPFFLITYELVNQFTATRADINSVVYSWEQYIPFIPLTIIPYCSLALLYSISLFLCRSVSEQTRQACRLVLASTIACISFLLFPLRFSFIRPKVEGFTGWWFNQLEQFNLSYNQSSILYIILSWLLWQHFLQHTRKRLRWLIHCWFLLISISVLTTWQHHFIDVIIGVVIGMFIDWLIPVKKIPKTHIHIPCTQSKKLTKYYAIAALVCLCFGICSTPWLLWLALSLFIVSCSYHFGVNTIYKSQHGKYSAATYILLFPWRCLMTISRWLYTRKVPAISPINEHIFMGSYPCSSVKQKAILDLTFEFPRAQSTYNRVYTCIPMLDLVCPSMLQLQQAVGELEKLRTQHNSVLIHCSLGLSRSAIVVVAWLLAFDNFKTVEQACTFVQQQRPQIVLGSKHMELLEQWHISITQNPMNMNLVKC